jgi:hypothetical protein
MTKKLPPRAKQLSKIDPKHDLFSALYFSPRLNGKPNPLFGNAYQCALQVGYSEATAIKITSATEDKQWLREAYQRLVSFKPEHIIKQLEDIALNSEYDRDRLKSLEMLAKISNMFIDRTQTEVNVTFTNSVPRPHMDVIDLPNTDIDIDHAKQLISE